MKVCENNNAFDCWVDADRVCSGECSSGSGVPSLYSYSFVDLSGRAWAIFYIQENLYLVDTNGDKGPNRFGKDRWMFTFAGDDGNRICSPGDANSCDNPGVPKRVIPYFQSDINSVTNWCHYPPCNYKSWLIN